MCSTGPFKFRWSRRYIHNSSYYHHQLFPLLSYVSVVVCLRCICLFERCTTPLASLYIHIWRFWTSTMLARYILSSVCLRLSQIPQLSFMQYMGLCVFSRPIYLMLIVRIHVLYLVIIIKSEVWPNCQCAGLGHETMVCAVCLSLFLFL